MKVLVLAVVVACSTNKPAPAPAPEAKQAPAPVAGPKGKVETKHFDSKSLGVEKDYLVYLPAGYDADPNKHWPVFYYLHGLTGNETNWVELAKLDQAADALALA